MNLEATFAALVRDAVRAELESLREELSALVREAAAKGRAPGSATTHRYISTAEAASIASVTPGTIRSWIDAGELRRYRAGRELRVRLDELEAYLARDSHDDVIDFESRAHAILGGR